MFWEENFFKLEGVNKYEIRKKYSGFWKEKNLTNDLRRWIGVGVKLLNYSE